MLRPDVKPVTANCGTHTRRRQRSQVATLTWRIYSGSVRALPKRSSGWSVQRLLAIAGHL